MAAFFARAGSVSHIREMTAKRLYPAARSFETGGGSGSSSRFPCAYGHPFPEEGVRTSGTHRDAPIRVAGGAVAAPRCSASCLRGVLPLPCTLRAVAVRGAYPSDSHLN
jgi:hypothetical protein